MNLSLARVYLATAIRSCPRALAEVLDEIIAIKTGPTQARWKSAARTRRSTWSATAS